MPHLIKKKIPSERCVNDKLLNTTDVNKLFNRKCQKFKPILDHESVDSYEDNGFLTDFISKSWTIFKASPLYRVNFKEVELRKLSKWLREEVVKRVPNAPQNTVYSVTFSTVEQTFSKSTENLKLEVTATINRRDQKILYEGYFLSHSERDMAISYKYHKALPIVLCRGPKTYLQIVHELVGNLFDCNILPILLTEDHLKLLAVVVINCGLTRRKDVITFKYQMDNKLFIQISGSINDLRQQWNHLRNVDSEEIEITDAKKFFTAVAADHRRVIGLFLEEHTLVQLSHEVLKIDSGGRFKAKNIIICNALFDYLQYVC